MAETFITGFRSFYKDDDGGVSTTTTCVSCQQACPFAAADSGTKTTGGSYLAYHMITKGMCVSATDYQLAWDSFTNISNRFYVYADGVSLYDTGCVTGNGSATITIPAGTKQIDLIVDGNCTGLPDVIDQWSFNFVCV